MVLKATVLDRVNSHLEVRGRRREAVQHDAQPDPLGAGSSRQFETIEDRQGDGSRPGRRQQTPEEPAGLSRHRRYRCRILVVERRTQCRRALSGNAISLGDRRHQARQSDVDRQLRHADRGQRLAGNRDRLDVGVRARRPDELGPDLADLALGPDLGAGNPQHLPGIAEAQRPRCVAKPRRGDPRDLRRHVGAHADHPVRGRVHHAKGGGRHRRPGSGEQCVFEFDERRLDSLVAMCGQCRHQLRHDLRFDLRLGRQKIVHAGGQQSRVRSVGHVIVFFTSAPQNRSDLTWITLGRARTVSRMAGVSG